MDAASPRRSARAAASRATACVSAATRLAASRGRATDGWCVISSRGAAGGAGTGCLRSTPCAANVLSNASSKEARIGEGCMGDGSMRRGRRRARVSVVRAFRVPSSRVPCARGVEGAAW